MKKSFKDAKGGEVAIASNFPEKLIRFTDTTTDLYIDPDTHFFDSMPHYPWGKKEQKNAAMLVGNSGIVCRNRTKTGRIWPFNNTVYATKPVIESVIRFEILTFMDNHPDIAAQVKAAQLPLTLLDGTPATLTELEKHTPQFRGCPTGNPSKIVERIR